MILTATINEVKRRILFDNPQAVVAVKGDYEVNGIAFAFPAIYEDDFDLSTAVKTVYYKATDGIIYNHVVTATDTDTGYPLWVFKDEINKGAYGDVEFALVCDKVEGGNIVKRWVSMITAFRVQKSIEIDESEQEENEQTYSERLAYLMTQMANMQATVSGLASGAPTAVSLASGMTDTNKLYVYTGSESGYTAGHWYYYNGSAWADGGQYGGTTVDATLTVSGAAADAKVTGDKIAEIKEDLSDINSNTLYGGENLFNPLDPDIEYGRYIEVVAGTGGSQVRWVTDDNYCESGYIPVKEGDSWEAYYVNPFTRSRRISLALYDENKNIIRGLYNAPDDYTFPAGVAYVRAPIRYKGNGRTPFSFVFTLNTTINEEYLVPSALSVVEAVHKLDGSQWLNKKWYAYGTSITNTNNEGKYPIYLSALSHLNLTNKGISGGGIGNLGAYSHGQVYNAICNTTDGKTEAELITLETGANDCNSNVPLGTVYDAGTTTLAGCLNDCIRYLQANTNAQIVVINSPATTTLPSADNQYYEWARMVREICNINRVYCITPCCNLGYGKLTSDNGTNYVVDSIHQTDLGGFIYASSIWTELRNIPLFYTKLPLPFEPEDA